MVTYDKFAEWLQAMLDNAVTRAETKHSVGVTESKLEEHKVNFDFYTLCHIMLKNIM